VKVGIVIYSPRFFGGGSKFACDLALSLMERGVEVAACAMETPLKGLSHEGLFQIQHWFTPNVRWNFGKLYRIMINQRFALKKLVKRFKPDVIIGADTEPSVMMGQKARKIMYVHFPTEFKIDKHSLRHELYRSLYWWQHYRALAELDVIVCNSEYTKQITYLAWQHCQPDEKKYTVIYPSVEVEKFKTEMKREPHKVCYVGRIDEKKGIEHVVEAFKQVKKDVPQARLEIVGGVKGSYWAELYYPKLLGKVREAEDIIIKRDVPEKVIIETFLTSRCMVSYNPEEHFGIVPVEAMAAGCPPIVADGGGQRETVKDGETGFLVKTPEEIAIYMKKLLVDEKIFKSMSEKARKHAENFSRKTFAEKWLRLLHEVGNIKS
jgi:glycosyltransferase involved in cell wall biosynthesis